MKAYRLRHNLPMTWQKDPTKTKNYQKVRNMGLKPFELCPAMSPDYKCMAGTCMLGGQTFGPGMEKEALKRMGCECMKSIYRTSTR